MSNTVILKTMAFITCCIMDAMATIRVKVL